MSLFRGLLSQMIGVPLMIALNFFMLGYFRQLLGMRPIVEGQRPEFDKLFAASVCSGTIACFIQSPLDLVKIVMQADRSHPDRKQRRAYANSVQAALDVWSARGLWRTGGPVRVRLLASAGVLEGGRRELNSSRAMARPCLLAAPARAACQDRAVHP